MNCPHKLGWGFIRLECEEPEGHDGITHSAMLDATKVTWLEGDRRDYQGEFQQCDGLQGRCILPGGHHGSHAS